MVEKKIRVSLDYDWSELAEEIKRISELSRSQKVVFITAKQGIMNTDYEIVLPTSTINDREPNFTQVKKRTNKGKSIGSIILDEF